MERAKAPADYHGLLLHSVSMVRRRSVVGILLGLGLILASPTRAAQSDRVRDEARLTAIIDAAEAAETAGDTRQQVEPLKEAIAIAERLGLAEPHAHALRLLSGVRWFAGAFAEALTYAQQSAAVARAAGDALSESRALRAASTALVSLGRHADALKALDSALEAARAANERLEEASVLTFQAGVFGPLGRLDDARTVLEAALALRGPSDTSGEQAQTLSLLGVVNRTQGNYEAALDCYQRALTIQRQQHPGGVGATLGNLGLVYLSLGQPERAIETTNEALALATTMGRVSTAAILHRNLADAFAKLSRVPQAIDHATKAVELSRTLGNPDRLSGALYALGSLRLTHDGDLPGATSAATEALTLARGAKLRTAESSALRLLGWVAYRQKQYDSALEHFDTAVERAGPRDAEYDARLGRGATLHAMDEDGRAEKDLRRALQIAAEARRVLASDVEKTAFADVFLDATALLTAVLVTQGRLAESLEVAESSRARGLADLLAQRTVRGKAAERDALAAVRNAADRARSGGGRGGPSADDLGAVLDRSLERLGKEGPELASLLTAKAPTFGEISSVAARLGATLVEYFVGGEGVHVWVVSPQGQLHHVRLDVDQRGLTTLVDQVRARLAVRTPRDAALAAGLRALDGHLIAPIAAWLPADPAATVVIVPAGRLQLLPFAALTNAAGTPLVARHTLAFAPSLGVFAYTASKRRLAAARPGALVVSDPTPPDPGALPALAGARREGAAVARQLGRTHVTLLEGAAATETAVKAAADSASTVHFATHGLVSMDRPLASSLVFAKSADDDGYLRVDEVFDLDLDATLVVLSGCSTGVGPVSSEGIAGLVRGFIYAGTPTVVASLWDVGDRSTAVLMAAFYRALAGGASKGAALRSAQLAARRQFPHPAQWAAFQLTGEPR